jgi:hypothetical protein
MTYEGDSNDANTPGIKGTNTAPGGSGVHGVNNTSVAVAGCMVGTRSIWL